MNDYFLPLSKPYKNFLNYQEYIDKDTESLHQKNKLLLGKKWIWYDKKIEYKINSHNLRMNYEIDEVIKNDYIIFFGCSYTFGVGMPVELTYPYLVSKSIDVPYVNAGVCGSSPEYIFFNILKFLFSVPNKPKILIINWPDIFRTFLYKKEDMFFLLPNSVFPEDKVFYESWISNFDDRMNKFKLLKNIVFNITKELNIKYFEFTQALNNKNIINDLPFLLSENHRYSRKIINLNNFWARDVCMHPEPRIAHYGIDNHLYVHKKILEWHNKF